MAFAFGSCCLLNQNDGLIKTPAVIFLFLCKFPLDELRDIWDTEKVLK